MTKMIRNKAMLARFGPQGGMTLIELMVAITISMILLVGVFSAFSSASLSLRTQTGLSRMQDEQRQAMMILSEVIQSAGYFGNPRSNTLSSAFPASGVFANAGQFIFGVDGANANTPDTLYVQYQSAAGDGVLNCLGNTNLASGTIANYVNALTASSTTSQITCALTTGGTTTTRAILGGVNLAASPTKPCTSVGYQGINNLKFSYGLDASETGSVTRYTSATTVNTIASGTGWSRVRSVQARLTMLYCAQQGAVPNQINFSRVIFLPNQI